MSFSVYVLRVLKNVKIFNNKQTIASIRKVINEFPSKKALIVSAMYGNDNDKLDIGNFSPNDVLDRELFTRFVNNHIYRKQKSLLKLETRSLSIKESEINYFLILNVLYKVGDRKFKKIDKIYKDNILSISKYRILPYELVLHEGLYTYYPYRGSWLKVAYTEEQALKLLRRIEDKTIKVMKAICEPFFNNSDAIRSFRQSIKTCHSVLNESYKKGDIFILSYDNS